VRRAGKGGFPPGALITYSYGRRTAEEQALAFFMRWLGVVRIGGSTLVADRPKSRSIQQSGSTRAALLQLTLFGPTRWVLNQSTTDIMQATVARPLRVYVHRSNTQGRALCLRTVGAERPYQPPALYLRIALCTRSTAEGPTAN
jgi:hypothetical protein